jgi:hypothetical protein
MSKLRIIPIMTVLFLLSFPISAFAQEKGAKLEFVKEFEDLGKMYIDALELTRLTIEFTNSGDQPLVLSNVRGCCGTRIADYTKNPVLPGQKGNVIVEFRLAPRAHNVSRTVSILSNDADGMKVFRIRGEVLERDSAFNPAPTSTMAPRTQ